MVSFISKELNEDRDLGKKLKEARERFGLSLERISAILGINAKYLAAFEENNPNDLPEGIYADKFLKRYAQYLGLEEYIISMLPIERKETIKGTQLSHNKDTWIKKMRNFIFSPTFIKSSFIFIILICGIVYLFSIFYNIVKPPKLNIIGPEDDLVVHNYIIRVVGETENEAKIFINDKEIFCSPKGLFEEDVDLKKGLNIVKISAKKKYSKESVVYRKIMVDGDGISKK